MFQGTATVRNELGIHARLAALLVQASSKFNSRITLIKEGIEVDGKSIMGVMMLAAEMGSKLVIRATGEDEVEAVQKLVDLIESGFKEE